MFVLDEADEMLDRGFAPDVERILHYAPSSRQTALFSATLPAWVMSVATSHVRNAVTIEFDADTPAPPEIEHVVYDIQTSAKLAALRTLLDRRGQQSVIVFGRTKHGVKNLAVRLEALGYPAAALQGNLSQNARERVMSDFRSGAVPILLATNVAARSLDVPEVGAVINYELPESAEWLTHRVGRTGRMGRAGRAITLLAPEDVVKWRQFEKVVGQRLERRPWDHPWEAAAAIPAFQEVPRVQTALDKPPIKVPANASVARKQPSTGAPTQDQSSGIVRKRRPPSSRERWRPQPRRRPVGSAVKRPREQA